MDDYIFKSSHQTKILQLKQLSDKFLGGKVTRAELLELEGLLKYFSGQS